MQRSTWIVIIVAIVLTLAFIGWAIYLIVTSRQKTGLFKPWEPPAEGGVFYFPLSRIPTPLTDEQAAMRQMLLQQALDDVTHVIATHTTPAPQPLE